MRNVQKRGRKECPECGAHRIMWGIADNTCPVCGSSLEHVPVIVPEAGRKSGTNPSILNTQERNAQCALALARRISVWNHW